MDRYGQCDEFGHSRALGLGKQFIPKIFYNMWILYRFWSCNSYHLLCSFLSSLLPAKLRVLSRVLPSCTLIEYCGGIHAVRHKVVRQRGAQLKGCSPSTNHWGLLWCARQRQQRRRNIFWQKELGSHHTIKTSNIIKTFLNSKHSTVRSYKRPHSSREN